MFVSFLTLKEEADRANNSNNDRLHFFNEFCHYDVTLYTNTSSAHPDIFPSMTQTFIQDYFCCEQLKKGIFS